jgi:hypothetical protein
MKTIIYTLVTIIIATGCRAISGDYISYKCDPEHQLYFDYENYTVEADSTGKLRNVYHGNMIRYRHPFEFKLQPFGRLKYRPRKRTSDTPLPQDLSMMKGNWEFSGDTLLVYFWEQKVGLPIKYFVKGDSLIPLNSTECWKKQK